VTFNGYLDEYLNIRGMNFRLQTDKFYSNILSMAKSRRRVDILIKVHTTAWVLHEMY
jgi:hypothetical protein